MLSSLWSSQCQLTWNARKQQRTFLPLLAGLFHPLVIPKNSFSVFAFFFLLFLFCAFQFQYSNEAKLPQVIAFLSCILPCQLILSIFSSVTLHKCRTFSHSFSCSFVVMLHSESLPNFHCGNRGMFLVWSLWAAKRVWFQRNMFLIAMCHWFQQEAGEVWKQWFMFCSSFQIPIPSVPVFQPSTPIPERLEAVQRYIRELQYPFLLPYSLVW